VNGKLKTLPGGKLGEVQAAFSFAPQDFRFTVGENGALYAWCMVVPAGGATLKIQSLGSTANLLGRPIQSVTLLGNGKAPLEWKQEAADLVIHCPATIHFATAVGFKIAFGGVK
jgi:alpha-L-fucosidase